MDHRRLVLCSPSSRAHCTPACCWRLRVITARNPVHAVLFLVLAFFSAACLWMLLHAEFLAIVLVLVYVGAVMVLFLFVVMMLDINIDRARAGFWRHLPLAARGRAWPSRCNCGWCCRNGHWQYLTPRGRRRSRGRQHRGAGRARPSPNTCCRCSSPALILLVAIVAAIALTLRQRKDTHAPESRRAGARCARRTALRIVKMPSEAGRPRRPVRR